MAKGRKPGFHMGPEHRNKIKNSNVLSELIRFAEGQIPPEDYPAHRVTASLGLLKKIMPDLTENMVKGEGDHGEIIFKTVYESRN